MIPETANLYYTKKLTEELQQYDTTSGLTNADIAIIVNEYTSAFPLPFLLVVFGYSFILMFDRVVIDSSHHHDIHAHPHQPDKDNDASDRDEIRQ